MAEFIDTYCHQNRIGAIVRFRCKDAWTLKAEEFRGFSQDILRHIIASESEETVLFQPYFRDRESTVSRELAKISRDLGVIIKLVEYRRLQVAEA